MLPDPGAGTSGLPDEDEFATASPGAAVPTTAGPAHRGLALPGPAASAAADGWGFISSPAGPTTRNRLPPVRPSSDPQFRAGGSGLAGGLVGQAAWWVRRPR